MRFERKKSKWFCKTSVRKIVVIRMEENNRRVLYAQVLRLISQQHPRPAAEGG